MSYTQASIGSCPSHTHRIKVGLIETDTLLREGMVALLNTVAEFQCVGAWGQVQEALSAIGRLRPHVLLLDSGLSEHSRSQLLNQLTVISPATRILVTVNCNHVGCAALSAQALCETGMLNDTVENCLQCRLTLGAHGILRKAQGFGPIAEGIRRVYASQPWREPASAPCLAEPFLSSRHSSATTQQGGLESLTLRELQVVRLIGLGYSNKRIASEMQLGYSTVKNYVSSILKKLRLEGRTQIALYAHGRNAEEGGRLPQYRRKRVS